jgi:hypothetical protein
MGEEGERSSLETFDWMNTPVIAFFCIGMDPVAAGTHTSARRFVCSSRASRCLCDNYELILMALTRDEGYQGMNRPDLLQ